MKIKELGIDGKDVGNIEVSDNIFSLKPRKDIIKMVVDWQISRHSKKTGCTKTRGEVAGSRKKIGPQKGSGGARHGNITAPIFVGGGIAHGPKAKGKHRVKRLNKKLAIQKPGFKFAEWELKGVPVRVAIGPKDLENGTFEIARRDTLTKEVVSKDGIELYIESLLTQIQESMYNRAFEYRDTHITKVENFDEFKEVLATKGGFVAAHWDGTSETEEKIKELTKATIRCIPLDQVKEDGKCVLTGAKSSGRVLFAKAY